MEGQWAKFFHPTLMSLIFYPYVQRPHLRGTSTVTFEAFLITRVKWSLILTEFLSLLFGAE